jgi:hypothetical protein
MEQHVAELWTIDAAECYALAQEKNLLTPYKSDIAKGQRANTAIAPPNIPEGLLVVVRLKTTVSSGAGDSETKGTYGATAGGSPSQPVVKRSRASPGDDDDDEFDRDDGKEDEDDEEEEDPHIARRRRILENAADAEAIRKMLAFNPLQRSLSDIGSFPTADRESVKGPTGPTCIAMFAPTGSAASARVSSELSAALVSWRISLKANGIPEHRGKGTALQYFNKVHTCLFNNVHFMSSVCVSVQGMDRFLRAFSARSSPRSTPGH